MDKKNICSAARIFDHENALNLFKDEIEFFTVKNEKLILHIPHSSAKILDDTSYVSFSKEIHDELALITDWETDKIFQADDVTTLKCDFSRIYCDVERLPENEQMDEVGRGIYYVKGIYGQHIRSYSKSDVDKVKALYNEHYHMFNDFIKDKLNKVGEVLIIDCHSFNNIPLPYENDNGRERPDICIGTNDYHTPIQLKDFVTNYFTDLGYSVAINFPYSNTNIPIKYLNKEKRVSSIMIEVNKDLYMDGEDIIHDKISELNKIMIGLMKVL